MLIRNESTPRCRDLASSYTSKHSVDLGLVVQRRGKHSTYVASVIACAGETRRAVYARNLYGDSSICGCILDSVPKS